jgi:hypothetical protein
VGSRANLWRGSAALGVNRKPIPKRPLAASAAASSWPPTNWIKRGGQLRSY